MTLNYEDICVRLGGRDILTGVDLCSLDGKIVGIVGANGCGKSTLIKTTFNMVSHHKGRVLVNGRRRSCRGRGSGGRRWSCC